MEPFVPNPTVTLSTNSTDQLQLTYSHSMKVWTIEFVENGAKRTMIMPDNAMSALISAQATIKQKTLDMHDPDKWWYSRD